MLLPISPVGGNANLRFNANADLELPVTVTLRVILDAFEVICLQAKKISCANLDIWEHPISEMGRVSFLTFQLIFHAASGEFSKLF